MFKRLPEYGLDTFVFEFEGQPITAARGDSVAVALLVAGVGATRTTPRHNRPRAPYCLMGACFDCIVSIDDAPDRQACMIEARPGMVVRRQGGAGDPRR